MIGPQENYSVGYKIYKQDCNARKYTFMAIWCNENNCLIVDKDSYFEIAKNVIEEKVETDSEKLARLENEYQMARWQHEYIYNNQILFSDFVVARATELEELAKKLREEKGDL